MLVVGNLYAKSSSVGTKAVGVKIGYVDVVYVFELLPETKIIESELMSFGKQLQKQIEASLKEYNQKKDAFERGYETMTESMRSKKSSEIQQLRKEIQLLQEREFPQKIAEKQNSLIQPVQEKIANAIEQIAKENGYTYVLNKNSREAFIASPLLYVDEAHNITNIVLKKLGVDPPVADRKNTGD